MMTCAGSDYFSAYSAWPESSSPAITGCSFSVAAKATALVTTGIYSRIRNPIYVSGMAFIGGILLIVRQPLLWLVILILIPMQVIRARNEARVLESSFGDAYREYRRRTWF